MAGITRQRLKELVKEVMTEESEYQTFFQKALDKADKSIPSMSDEEKKAFFNKIDSAWNGKGEKNEALVGGQKELDVDGDGEIEGSDLADLRAGKKADESVNEISSIDGLTDVMKGQTSQIEGTRLSKGMAEHIINWMNTSPYGKKYNPWVKKNSIAKILPIAFNWGLERGLPANLKSEFVALKAKHGKGEKAESVKEAMQSGLWVGFTKTPKGKKYYDTFKSGKDAEQWAIKNNGGAMPKSDWDSKEAKYAVN